jgi:DNA-binding transcriptional MerR regulator
MSYSVQQLATIAGVTVRTLHHYDEIGLLKPSRVQGNGYRQYEEKELLKLQQILFFRELDFGPPEIKKIISSPSFDMKQALKDQRNLIELKKKRLSKLIETIDKTINKITNKTTMTDKQLYTDFNTDEQDQYAAEAKERWGHTEAYKQSQERVKKMTKEDMARIKKAGEDLTKKISEVMPKGPTSKEAQELIAQHFNGLRAFYEPSYEMYRGLGEMYVADPRFTAYYDKYAKGLAVFMRDAMKHYADTQERK